mmetsp:Transcript_4910/g.14197  ORF Transcript_4910/g.14197 Transcript_4910/m.14197 type:complete len:87 (+) Transcript_4910:772-1032(+)
MRLFFPQTDDTVRLVVIACDGNCGHPASASTRLAPPQRSSFRSDSGMHANGQERVARLLARQQWHQAHVPRSNQSSNNRIKSNQIK